VENGSFFHIVSAFLGRATVPPSMHFVRCPAAVWPPLETRQTTSKLFST
jgi:hypothetical protein